MLRFHQSCLLLLLLKTKHTSTFSIVIQNLFFSMLQWHLEEISCQGKQLWQGRLLSQAIQSYVGTSAHTVTKCLTTLQTWDATLWSTRGKDPLLVTSVENDSNERTTWRFIICTISREISERECDNLTDQNLDCIGLVTGLFYFNQLFGKVWNKC